MNRLIEALKIFANYADLEWPTICEHDILHIVGISREQVTDEDHARLVELDFDWDEDYGYFSYHFGSA